MIILWKLDANLERLKSIINESYRIGETLDKEIREKEAECREINNMHIKLRQKAKRLYSSNDNHPEGDSQQGAFSRSAKLDKDIDTANLLYSEARKELRKLIDRRKEAQAIFDDASESFRERLEALNQVDEVEKVLNKAIAEEAGVPSEFLNDVVVIINDDGTIHIYFGGIGSPLGYGHGHYVMTSEGAIIYKRRVFGSRGPHNLVATKVVI